MSNSHNKIGNKSRFGFDFFPQISANRKSYYCELQQQSFDLIAERIWLWHRFVFAVATAPAANSQIVF
jgi:hypothetical protein